ncbi:MAG: DUF4956 domain-containing protein [Gemmiger sp.]
MSFKDVIKKSVLSGFQTDISLTQIAVTLGFTILLALFIFLIYRVSSDSNFYSKDFNKTMVSMSVVTAAIVLAMQSNIIISLGMVGALSIVRFRNAVKNPLDLLFLFWSISVGIICGAGLYSVAILSSLAVTALIFLLDLVDAPKAPYILVVNCSSSDVESGLLAAVKAYAKGVRVRTRNHTMSGSNYVIELQTKQEQQLLSACEQLAGVTSVSLLAHDGELRY